uniref:Uncharacterized protein n=1 Tax=Trypanosoma congolense (strain IL3000) TaxID=1068625 RepID=G0UTK5_TRYCI|nr:hypothetical protein, unlikely [Trypanosoma congolense IL3000]
MRRCVVASIFFSYMRLPMTCYKYVTVLDACKCFFYSLTFFLYTFIMLPIFCHPSFSIDHTLSSVRLYLGVFPVFLSTNKTPTLSTSNGRRGCQKSKRKATCCVLTC